MKNTKKHVQKKYRITFYERIISEWEDNSYEILEPIEIKAYTKRQVKYLAGKHLRMCGKYNSDNKYGSVEYRYSYSIELIGIVSDEEKLKAKEEKERKKIEKQGFEQISLFDDNLNPIKY